MNNIDSSSKIPDVYVAWNKYKKLIGEKPKSISVEHEKIFKKIFYWNSEDNLDSENLAILELLNHDRLFWKYSVILALQNKTQWYEPVLELMFQNLLLV